MMYNTFRASMFRSQELTDSSTRDTESLRPRPRDGWEVEEQLQKMTQIVKMCQDFQDISRLCQQ